MKKIYSIMALLLTAVFTFTMTSCGDDDDDDNDPKNAKVEVSDLKDTGSALTFTISASAQGQSVKGTYVFGYDLRGNITSHVEDYTCTPSAMADSFKAQFEDDPTIKVLTKNGNKLHIEYDEASLEGMTKDVVKDFIYPQIKKGIYEQFK